MTPSDFGIEGITEEDRAYNGSRFAEVRDAIFANPYQKVWGREGEPPLPFEKPALLNFVRGILPFARRYYFGQASKRSVDSHADLRWGPDGKGFRRLIHPNGVCLTGLWEITEDTEYSGCFKKNSRALVIGRYSTGAETKRGRIRAMALVGKLFPATDPNHPNPLQTASFLAMQDIGGDTTFYMNDAELRSAPDVTPWRGGIASFLGLAVASIVFVLVDRKATVRQLYQIAELGKPLDELTRAPLYMRLLVASEQPRIEGDHLDIRDEVLAQIFDKGDPIPKRRLVFHIEVTDEGWTLNILGFVRRRFKNWRRIGKLTFDNAVASYNGDRVIHFNHPGWRNQPNNPATANRAAIS